MANHVFDPAQADRQSNDKSSTYSSRHAAHGMTAFGVARAAESTQWRQYNKSTGHGHAAEDANALNDKLRLHSVKKTGADNSFRGPDRIDNGQFVQTKYCQNARISVNAAFTDKTGRLGNYQYPGQVLEVPADQYEQALGIMSEKIRTGKVPGFTDPADAHLLIRKGSITYEQALKIAKAGNVESLKFDIKNNAKASATVGLLSGLVSFGAAKANGASNKEAAKQGVKTSAQAAAIAMGTGVLTQQFLRTAAGRTTSAMLQNTAKRALDSAMTTEMGKKAIEKTASAIGSKAVTGIAARNTLTKMASSNVVTAVAAGLLTSIPDTIRVVNGDISGKEYGIRMAENGAGVTGGVGGTWAGAAIGSCICPGIGTVIGGLLGGIFGGMGASKVVGSMLR